MDEMLAGLGKAIGTLQLGNVSDWVGGVIATVALLVAVVTQRRQQSDSLMTQALQVYIDREHLHTVDEAYIKIARITIHNGSKEVLFDVAVRKEADYYRPGVLMQTKAAYDSDLQMLSVVVDSDSPHLVEAMVEKLEAGESCQIEFRSKEIEVYFEVAFKDSKGYLWRRNLFTHQLMQMKSRPGRFRGMRRTGLNGLIYRYFHGPEW